MNLDLAITNQRLEKTSESAFESTNCEAYSREYEVLLSRSFQAEKVEFTGSHLKPRPFYSI